jgi:AraC-like DNA-binding protein
VTSDALPLGGHTSLRTSDLGEAREWVSRSLRPHRLELVESGAVLKLVHNVVDISPAAALHYIDYGCEIRVNPGALETMVLVQIPLRGAARTICGDQEIVSTPSLASVASPTDPLSMHYSDDCPRLMVKLDREAVERRLALRLGRSLRTSIRFDLGMRFDDPAARSWRAAVDLAFGDAERGGLSTSALIAQSFESLLIDGLLEAQPHSYTQEMRSPATAARPRVISRAMALIDERCADPLTTVDIAERVGVSVRSLQDGFHTHLATSPMAYLRDIRMQRVRELLQIADPARTNVTTIALQWGFTHLGRFAQDYRRRFGEAPSQTLRGAG